MLGHEVGLHPTYDAWNDSELLEEQKKTLEEKPWCPSYLLQTALAQI